MARSGWATGIASLREPREWLTIAGSAYRAPVLHASTGEAVATALAGDDWVAHVTEVRHGGVTGPRGMAYRITPGTLGAL
jgi:hypothetical protein